MADSVRIEELRRRVQKDPASIAFAQLAEEYRRAGRLRESIETCETGLARHPGYLSARVTLGRALLEIGQLDKAQEELRRVLRTAPENLAALRGLAEIHHRRGELQEALAHYRTALEFARHDAELEHVIAEISEQLEPSPRAPQVVDGLSYEEAAAELLAFSGHGADAVPLAAPEPGALEPEPVVVVPELSPAQTDTARFELAPAAFPPEAAMVGPESSPVDIDPPAIEPEPPAGDPSSLPPESDAWELGELPADPLVAAAFGVPASAATESEVPVSPAPAAAFSGEEADRQLAALERWLEAIVADRERRTPSA